MVRCGLDPAGTFEDEDFRDVILHCVFRRREQGRAQILLCRQYDPDRDYSAEMKNTEKE